MEFDKEDAKRCIRLTSKHKLAKLRKALEQEVSPELLDEDAA